MHPTARADKLTIQELADETLVFDHEAGKAHCLNRTARLVWKECDGRTSCSELAQKLNVPEVAVELALEQLHRRRLLDGSARSLEAAAAGGGRRDALRKLAAAAVLLPAIMTISAPAALAQASPPPPVADCTGQPNFTPCDGVSQCCNEVCFPPIPINGPCALDCECASRNCTGTCQP